MRISLIAVGSTGDVQPMVLLGQELMGRGHEVQLFAFSALEPLAARAGVSFRALSGDAEKYIGSIIQPGANPVSFLRRLMGALQDILEPLLAEAYEAFLGADVVVCTFCGSTPYAMAEKTGVPFFQVNLSPIDPTGLYTIPIMPGLPLGRTLNRALYSLAFRMMGAVERRCVHPWCERYGLPKRPGGSRPDYRLGSRNVSVLYAFSEHVVPRAPEWGDAICQTGFFDEEAGDFTPSAALASFLDGGDPPLYIGFGSMTSGDAGESVRAVLEALAQTGLRAVLSPGWSGMAETALPQSVYCEKEFVPHGWLFAQMRAVVHHGGAGTTAAGLRVGVPTLVVPYGSDQFFWGERVHALGCGPKPLPRAKLTGSSLAKRLQALVSTAAYRQNAAEVSQKLRKENGIRQAAKAIEEAVEPDRRRAARPLSIE